MSDENCSVNCDENWALKYNSHILNIDSQTLLQGLLIIIFVSKKKNLLLWFSLSKSNIVNRNSHMRYSG